MLLYIVEYANDYVLVNVYNILFFYIEILQPDSLHSQENHQEKKEWGMKLYIHQLCQQ